MQVSYEDMSGQRLIRIMHCDFSHGVLSLRIELITRDICFLICVGAGNLTYIHPTSKLATLTGALVVSYV
jgi:hypothetical protein